MASSDINEPQHALRFLNVDEEPLKMLPPILDYEITPLVSIDEAIVPLGCIMPSVRNMVETVQMVSCSELEEGLTRDQSNSIRLYSLEWQPRECSLFYVLNKALRSRNRQQLQPWLLFLRLFLNALSQLPSAPLTVYRGINMDLTKQYPVGKNVVWWGFSSCMKKSNLLEKKLFLNNTGKRTLFIINCYSGKDIYRHSMYKCEGEVLLSPARQFHVVSAINKGEDLHIIELNEIQPAFDFVSATSTPLNISIHDPTHKIQFQHISTVSLSKKSLPASLPNLRLEEHLSYFFKQSSSINLERKNLINSDMETIVSEVVIKRQCLELNLSSNRFTYNAISILAQTLRKNNTLTTLNLRDNQIGDKGVQHLGKALRINTGLTTLNLRDNQIGDKGAQHLGKALRVNRTLTTLNLERNKIGYEGAQDLSEALRINTTLTTFTLWHNQIEDEGAQHLGEALQINMTLTTLNLGVNHIRDKGAQYLGEALRVNTTLTSLDLSGNPIGHKGAEYLAEALRINSTLTTLVLWDNEIEDKGAQYLGEALRVNTTLTTFNLSGNQIGHKGAEHLGEALRINRILTTLVLWDNEIGDEGAQDLSEALRINTTLTTLDLRYNQIGGKGAQHLGEALRMNKTLTTLNLSINQIGDKEAEHLGKALRINRTLITLNLRDNQIGDKGAQHLSEALRINRTLMTLSLQNNGIGEAVMNLWKQRDSRIT